MCAPASDDAAEYIRSRPVRVSCQTRSKRSPARWRLWPKTERLSPVSSMGSVHVFPPSDDRFMKTELRRLRTPTHIVQSLSFPSLTQAGPRVQVTGQILRETAEQLLGLPGLAAVGRPPSVDVEEPPSSALVGPHDDEHLVLGPGGARLEALVRAVHRRLDLRPRLPRAFAEATRTCFARGVFRHHWKATASSPEGPTARSPSCALTPFSDGRSSTSVSHVSFGLAMATPTAPPPALGSAVFCHTRNTSPRGPTDEANRHLVPRGQPAGKRLRRQPERESAQAHIRMGRRRPRTRAARTGAAVRGESRTAAAACKASTVRDGKTRNRVSLPSDGPRDSDNHPRIRSSRPRPTWTSAKQKQRTADLSAARCSAAARRYCVGLSLPRVEEVERPEAVDTREANRQANAGALDAQRLPLLRRPNTSSRTEPDPAVTREDHRALGRDGRGHDREQVVRGALTRLIDRSPLPQRQPAAPRWSRTQPAAHAGTAAAGESIGCCRSDRGEAANRRHGLGRVALHLAVRPIGGLDRAAVHLADRSARGWPSSRCRSSSRRGGTARRCRTRARGSESACRPAAATRGSDRAAGGTHC